MPLETDFPRRTQTGKRLPILVDEGTLVKIAVGTKQFLKATDYVACINVASGSTRNFTNDSFM